MTTDELYSEAIVREARAARDAARLPDPDVSVTADNPLCGDRVTLDLKLGAGGRVAGIGHKTRGCMLTQAAASLLARRGADAAPADLARAEAELEAMLRGEEPGAGLAWPELAMFRPVSRVKSRHECVRLPFEALREAVAKAGGRAS